MKVAVIVCALLAVGFASVVRRQAPPPAHAAPPAGGNAPSRTAYVLADGAQSILGDFSRSFSCDGKKYGYFADIANGCKIFHVCVPEVNDQGTPTGPVIQYSFFCGNTTVFDQSKLICASADSAIPCQNSESFFTINDKFGVVGPQP